MDERAWQPAIPTWKMGLAQEAIEAARRMVVYPDFVRGGPWVASRLTKADWEEVHKASACPNLYALKQPAAREVAARHGYSLLANHLNCTKFGSRNAMDPLQLAGAGPWPSSMPRPLPVNSSGARTPGSRISGWKAYRGDAPPGSSLWPSGQANWEWFNLGRAQAKAKSKAKAQGKAKAKSGSSTKGRKVCAAARARKEKQR